MFQYNFLIRNLFQPSGIISVCEIGDSSKGVVAAPGMTDKGDNSHSDNAMALTGLSWQDFSNLIEGANVNIPKLFKAL